MRKRCLAAALCLLLCAALAGCMAEENGITFYYLRREYAYGTEDAVIAPETREAQSARNLEYLLRLYLDGPLTDAYVSPFPSGTHLISLGTEDGTLTVTLSEEFAALEGADLTLAAASLARTCFALTDAEEITILAAAPEEVCLTLNRDSLVLLDDSAAEATEEQEN